jgi:Mce-associated membrane protein
MSHVTARSIAMLVLSVVSGVAAFAPRTAAAPTDPAQLAACDFGWQLTTYDFDSYDDYDRRVLERATGVFRDQFLGSSAERRALVEAARTRSEAHAVECYTDSGDAGRAEVLVTVDQSTISTASGGVRQPTRTVMLVALENIDGRWLAGRVHPIGPAH